MPEMIRVKALVPLQTIDDGKKVKKPIGSEFGMDKEKALRLSKKPRPPVQLVNEDDGKSELQLAREKITELEALVKEKDEKIEELSRNPSDTATITIGAVDAGAFSGQTEESQPITPLDVNVKQAANIIAETEDVDLLKSWLEEEKEADNRKTVLQAIEKRISELTEGGE